MKKVKNIVSLAAIGRFLSVALMLFLLSFLTVGNLFVYGDPFSVDGIVATGDNNDIDDSKRPITSEEEKSSSSKSVSSNLTEEYLHEQDLALRLYISLDNFSGDYIHTHGFGDDHSSLHCPPPDRFI